MKIKRFGEQCVYFFQDDTGTSVMLYLRYSTNPMEASFCGIEALPFMLIAPFYGYKSCKMEAFYPKVVIDARVRCPYLCIAIQQNK